MNCYIAVVAFGCGTIPLPESPTPYELAQEAALRGEYETAITQLTAAINKAKAEDHVFTAAHLKRGECYLQSALEPKDPDSGEDDSGKGDARSALVDFKKALKAEPELPREERGRALVGSGQAYRVLGDEKSAEEQFRLFLEFPPTDENVSFRVEAHRHLGQILMERARNALKGNTTVEEELLSQKHFRQAQHEFSKGLEIDANDEGCNLGKGICLHFGQQDRAAIGFLSKATGLCEVEGVDCARGYYFLGRALEINKGHHRQALEHYRKAVEQDTERSFTPLYAHLVEVLPAYLSFKEPEFGWFFDKMLDYTGEDQDYWTSVERLAAPMEGSPVPECRETGIFALAVARSRNDKIKAAVEDALQLEDAPDFIPRLVRIFPKDKDYPQYLYGHALTLLEARRYEELESFLGKGFLATLDPPAMESHYYHRTLVLEGRNIVERWRENNSGSPLADDEKPDRDRKLGEARDAFQGYLEKYPADQEVSMLLGDVQERMEVYTAAYLSYAQVAREAPYHSGAFRGVVRLHADELLPPKELDEAWSLLRQYTGNEADVTEYINGVAHAIQKGALLYCRGCGRKCSEGETTCLECGHQLAPSLRGK